MLEQPEQLQLELKNIKKAYPGVIALDDVSISFRKGEVHAIAGENGAGKSTLIKIIAGAISPDEGEIQVGDKTFSVMNPSLSKKEGIQVIYQEFNLIPSLSVAENIFLGDFIGNGITINRKEMISRTKEIFNRLKITIDPLTPVEDLSVAYQQLVEIAKAVSKEVKVLIMDEPSAPLTKAEVDTMFHIVKKLKDEGVLIIYISHKLEEIFEICDRITVMRDGKKIETKNIDEIDRDELIHLMVGRELKETFPPRKPVLGEKILEARKLTGNGVKDISFHLSKGEILGICGLVGSGRTEMVRMLFGAEEKESGEVLINNKPVSITSPEDAIKLGIGLIPEDRKSQGALLDLSIKWNISMSSLKKISRGTVIRKKEENTSAVNYKESLRIKTPSLEQLVKNLSGGNQQKVIIAKWLMTNSNIIIFDEPTRGIDVGAKQEIYKLINKLTDEGLSIIMISSEMEEVLGMADRILVLAEGKIAGELSREEFNQDTIFEYASGMRKTEE